MTSKHKLFMQIRMLFARKRAGRRLEEELRFHLDQQTSENIASGMSPDDARRTAMRTFGNPGLVREQVRATWNWYNLDNLGRDLRYGVRTLLRSPGFALVSVLVMALGIGATTSLFTMVRAVLLRPLPFRDSGRLVMLYEHFRDVKSGDGFNSVAPGDYRDWRSQTHGFEDMAAMRGYGGIVSGVHSELPEVVQSAGGSANLFPLLGVTPAYGRLFTEAEDQPKAEPVVLLTWSFFQRRLPVILPSSASKFTWIPSQPPWLACCRTGLTIRMRGSSSGCRTRRPSLRRTMAYTTSTRAKWWRDSSPAWTLGQQRSK